MKKLIILLFMCLFLIGTYTVGAKADGETYYEISLKNGNYCFYKDGILTAESESLEVLINGLSSLGKEIRFCGVKSAEQINLEKGRYIFSGDLSVDQIRILEGTQLNLEGLSLTVNNGIKLNGGELIFNTGTVITGSSAVEVNYSPTSRLIMNGGELMSEVMSQQFLSDKELPILTADLS